MEIANKEKKRIEYIDLAKGITILLVILGHSIENEKSLDFLQGMIFSFHMPLFFILSCMTFKWSGNIKEYFKKTFKALRHLIVPVLVIALIMTIWQIIDYNMQYGLEGVDWGNYFTGQLLSVLYASGRESYFGDVCVAPLNLPWFLVVLFLGRSIYDLIRMLCVKRFWHTLLCAAALVLSGVGVFLSQASGLYLMLSFDLVLLVQVYMWVGDVNRGLFEAYFRPFHVPVCLVLWLAGFTALYNVTDHRYLELAVRSVPYTFWAIALSVVGCFFMLGLCRVLEKYAAHLKSFLWLGRYSLYMFYAHALDDIWSPLWNIEGAHIGLCILLRIIEDCAVCVLIVKIKGLFKNK